MCRDTQVVNDVDVPVKDCQGSLLGSAGIMHKHAVSRFARLGFPAQYPLTLPNAQNDLLPRVLHTASLQSFCLWICSSKANGWALRYCGERARCRSYAAGKKGRTSLPFTLGIRRNPVPSASCRPLRAHMFLPTSHQHFDPSMSSG